MEHKTSVANDSHRGLEHLWDHIGLLIVLCSKLLLFGKTDVPASLKNVPGHEHSSRAIVSSASVSTQLSFAPIAPKTSCQDSFARTDV